MGSNDKKSVSLTQSIFLALIKSIPFNLFSFLLRLPLINDCILIEYLFHLKTLYKRFNNSGLFPDILRLLFLQFFFNMSLEHLISFNSS